jgi:hypothetical protein
MHRPERDVVRARRRFRRDRSRGRRRRSRSPRCATICAGVIAAGSFGRSASPSGLLRAILLAALDHANARLYAQSGSHEDFVGSGTSLTAVMLVGHQALVGHVGDARAYLLRLGRLDMLTSDDAMFADTAVTSAKNALPAKPRTRGLLWRSLGTQAKLEASIAHVELLAGDQLVLCTDGVHRCVDDDELPSAARRARRRPTPSRACSPRRESPRQRRQRHLDRRPRAAGRHAPASARGHARGTAARDRCLALDRTSLLSFGAYAAHSASPTTRPILRTIVSRVVPMALALGDRRLRAVARAPRLARPAVAALAARGSGARVGPARAARRAARRHAAGTRGADLRARPRDDRAALERTRAQARDLALHFARARDRRRPAFDLPPPRRLQVHLGARLDRAVHAARDLRPRSQRRGSGFASAPCNTNRSS